MAVPSMEDFAEMARAASTPFHGRRPFLPEEDENTCAVQIVFKKPAEPPAAPSRVPPATPSPPPAATPPPPPAVVVSSEQHEVDEDMKPAAAAAEAANAADLSFIPQQPQVPMSPIMETSR